MQTNWNVESHTVFGVSKQRKEEEIARKEDTASKKKA
jgi:hypothetical protein